MSERELQVNGKLILSSWCCFKQETCWVPSGSNVPSPVCPQGLACLMWRILRCQGPSLGWGTAPEQLQAPSTGRSCRAVSGTWDGYKVCLPSQEFIPTPTWGHYLHPRQRSRKMINGHWSGGNRRVRHTYNYCPLLMTPLATGSNTVSGGSDDAAVISLSIPIGLIHTACQWIPK